MREVQMKATLTEEVDGRSWSMKEEKLLWRGAIMGLKLREKFLKATKDKPWADVKVLNWHDENFMANDLKSMPEHCHNKCVAHTEGNSYSGRLKYLQSCKSVVVAHKMEWIQHHHPLMNRVVPSRILSKSSAAFMTSQGRLLGFRRTTRRLKESLQTASRRFGINI